MIFFFKHKTAYEMRISDWSSDVCSSDLVGVEAHHLRIGGSEQRLAVRVARRGERVDLVGDRAEFGGDHRAVVGVQRSTRSRQGQLARARQQRGRSEERRVGKEGVQTCRSRGSQDREKKKI